jgi:hypothetical protein
MAIYQIISPYDLTWSLLNQFNNVKYEAKVVVNNCKNGDTNIIRTSQPTKLIFGSYSIIGIPKFMKSLAGSKSMEIIGPQIMLITPKVKSEVIRA